MAPVNALRWAVVAASVMAVAAHASVDLGVPSLDFRTLAYDSDVAVKLQEFGIVTIKNVPGYASLRQQYLLAAAECAWQRRSPDARGVLYRELDDGTQRLTISSTKGMDSVEPGACSKYQQSKKRFSGLVAKAIDGFSAAFDASFTAVSQSSSLRELVSEARDMDHFHAYVPVHMRNNETSQAAASATSQSSETDVDLESKFALSMHSDSGLFIAMSAPAFFQVVSSENSSALLQEIANPDPASGLMIKLSDGTVVRPVQKPDELTVMVGDGFSTWVQLPVKIPAVVHGMLMPQTCHKETQVIRAWFGKMVLLSETTKMLNTGVEFAAYSRQLGGFVGSGSAFPSQFASAACPAHRQLQQNACSYRLCHPMSSGVSEDQCEFWCNRHNMEDINFAQLCQSHCLCQHHAVTENTFECWMSCFERRRENSCVGGEQTCIEQQVGENKIAVWYCNDAANATTTTTASTAADGARTNSLQFASLEEDDESSESESDSI